MCDEYPRFSDNHVCVCYQDASVSRSEEAIIYGHWNKTLCRSPDDTCEFARAAQLASTPSAGVERPRQSGSGLTENLSRTAPESTKAPSSVTTAEENKLRYFGLTRVHLLSLNCLEMFLIGIKMSCYYTC